ncbi:MAG: acetyltransferase [Coriobacteriia bacterium]|jgi:sugar O-acyltransferase (sialic acid O-acetyltransferase NeuD family)|nr:acetyltransferase [Coriobacteriia bacterium]
MRFLIVGAGGFSREVADLISDLGHEVAAFFDEEPRAAVHSPTGLPIVDDPARVDRDAVAIAIGDAAVRKRLFERFAGEPLPVLVHPSASVSPSAEVGENTLIMHNAVVSAQAQLGIGVIVNVGCYVAHDCRVGSFTHLAGGVNLGGGAAVGEGCLCGTGSIVLPGIEVGDGAVLGAGAVVLHDVAGGAKVVGVPARALELSE